MGTGFSDCCAAEALTLDGKKEKSHEYDLLAKAKAFETLDDDINSAEEGYNHMNGNTESPNLHNMNLKAPNNMDPYLMDTNKLKIENTTSNQCQIANTMRLIKRKKMNSMSRGKSAPSRGAYDIQRSIDKIKENELFIRKYGSYFSSTNTSSTNVTTTDDIVEFDAEFDPEFDEDDKTETHPQRNHLEMPLEIEDSYDLQADAEDMALINAVAACDPNAVLTPPQGPQPQPYKNTAAIFSNGISDESFLSVNSLYSNHYGTYQNQQRTRYHYPPKGPVIRPMNGPSNGPNVSAPSTTIPSNKWSPSLSMRSVSYTNNNEYENDCYNVSGCKAIKRIIRALRWYHIYIDNDNESEENRGELLLQRILNCGYDKHILDDYQHILNHHLIQCVNSSSNNINNGKSEYELICDEINKQIEPCDIKTCIGYKRFQDIVKQDMTQCNDRQFVIDFMDLIHCYLMHNQFL